MNHTVIRSEIERAIVATMKRDTLEPTDIECVEAARASAAFALGGEIGTSREQAASNLRALASYLEFAASSIEHTLYREVSG